MNRNQMFITDQAYLGPALLWLVCLGCLGPAFADERLAGIACRSVHLSYAGGEGLAFYSEVTPQQSAPGTFFMACGWNTGYFGLQELGNGKKLLIFSVWDNARGDDPTAVDDDVRVKLLHQDPAVRVGRFGGEGTGGQSFLDYDWQIGQTYRLLVTASPNGRRTEYSGYFYHPQQKLWKKLVTFSTLTGGKPMRGFYAFIEDFKRDRQSTQNTRRARFGNVCVRGSDGQWRALRSATFTADANPVENIDAGVDADQFFLATGGPIQNTTTKLKATLGLRAELVIDCPVDVQELVGGD